jgi:hypothetical protein
MARATPSWLRLSAGAMGLAWEAQSVIALRTWKFATGGDLGGSEFNLMFAEKTAAALDVQAVMGKSMLDGKAHLAAERALAMYRRRVRANRRRLTGGK